MHRERTKVISGKAWITAWMSAGLWACAPGPVGGEATSVADEGGSEAADDDQEDPDTGSTGDDHDEGSTSAGNTGASGSTAASSSSTTSAGETSTSSGDGGTTSTGDGTSSTGVATADATEGSSEDEGSENSGSVPTMCPASATFCADFEGEGLPDQATYVTFGYPPDWTRVMSLDTADPHGGSQSLRVDPTEQLQMLMVPAPSPSFWARIYIKSDVTIGEAGTSDHQVYLIGSEMAGSDFNQWGVKVEVAQQHQTIGVNVSDAVTNADPLTQLDPDVWHCLEASYDGAGGVVDVFANGEPIIHATVSGLSSYAGFAFGYWHPHPQARTIWYDDVAVGPERIGCLP